jgi:hypothetical protein
MIDVVCGEYVVAESATSGSCLELDVHTMETKQFRDVPKLIKGCPWPWTSLKELLLYLAKGLRSLPSLA